MQLGVWTNKKNNEQINLNSSDITVKRSQSVSVRAHAVQEAFTFYPFMSANVAHMSGSVRQLTRTLWMGSKWLDCVQKLFATTQPTIMMICLAEYSVVCN